MKVFRIDENEYYKIEMKTVISIEEIDQNIKLIAYFGYLYTNNYSMDYYLAAQQLIWENLGLNIEYYLLSGDKKIPLFYEKYKNNI